MSHILFFSTLVFWIFLYLSFFDKGRERIYRLLGGFLTPGIFSHVPRNFLGIFLTTSSRKKKVVMSALRVRHVFTILIGDLLFIFFMFFVIYYLLLLLLLLRYYYATTTLLLRFYSSSLSYSSSSSDPLSSSLHNSSSTCCAINVTFPFSSTFPRHSPIVCLSYSRPLLLFL